MFSGLFNNLETLQPESAVDPTQQPCRQFRRAWRLSTLLRAKAQRSRRKATCVHPTLVLSTVSNGCLFADPQPSTHDVLLSAFLRNV